jgi:hypothetical protein
LQHDFPGVLHFMPLSLSVLSPANEFAAATVNIKAIIKVNFLIGLGL